MTAPTSTSWVGGVAEVIASDTRTVTVACPHCGGDHEHGKAVLGSRSIAARCHAGFTRCREYKVVDTGKRGRR